MLSNNFVKVRHASVFEGIKLADSNGEEKTPTPIQKLMSVPVFGDHQNVLAVVQISRKGKDAVAAGPDFSQEDLHRLEEAAALIAKVQWMQESSALEKSI
jgi:hypothetical protein